MPRSDSRVVGAAGRVLHLRPDRAPRRGSSPARRGHRRNRSPGRGPGGLGGPRREASRVPSNDLDGNARSTERRTLGRWDHRVMHRAHELLVAGYRRRHRRSAGEGECAFSRGCAEPPCERRPASSSREGRREDFQHGAQGRSRARGTHQGPGLETSRGGRGARGRRRRPGVVRADGGVGTATRGGLGRVERYRTRRARPLGGVGRRGLPG